eukprot:28652-Eustigmatos_ZCMA.PRE.1
MTFASSQIRSVWRSLVLLCASPRFFFWMSPLACSRTTIQERLRCADEIHCVAWMIKHCSRLSRCVSLTPTASARSTIDVH